MRVEANCLNCQKPIALELSADTERTYGSRFDDLRLGATRCGCGATIFCSGFVGGKLLRVWSSTDQRVRPREFMADVPLAADRTSKVIR